MVKACKSFFANLNHAIYFPEVGCGACHNSYVLGKYRFPGTPKIADLGVVNIFTPSKTNMSLEN